MQVILCLLHFPAHTRMQSERGLLAQSASGRGKFHICPSTERHRTQLRTDYSRQQSIRKGGIAFLMES